MESSVVTLTWIAFVMGASLVLLVSLLVGSARTRVDARLAQLSGKARDQADQDPMAEFARTALPRMGAPLMPRDAAERTKLQTRLIHAGFYKPEALYLFLGVKMLLILGPLSFGVALGLVNFVPVSHGLIGGAMLGVLGMIAPSFWLDKMKANRQTSPRRSLPDAMDVLVVCLEGGLSLPGGLRRVSTELRTAHPQLAREMSITQREIQLGWSPGEALRRLGERSDLEEIRSLASVITQAERFGASLVKALRVHAETLRNKRLQYAEEMAQKAVIKILFPSVLFIFPAMFIVILGPAVILFLQEFAKLNQ